MDNFQEGDRTICRVCQEVIIYTVVYWRHAQYKSSSKPVHVAAPFDTSRIALDREGLLNKPEYSPESAT